MTKTKPKFYVVWSGKKPGVYLTWDDCKAQVMGVKEARYKAYPSMEEAQQAFSHPAPTISRTPKPKSLDVHLPVEVIQNAYAVDAACSGNPGMMEYQGVDVQSKARLFHLGPLYGTNNIGEFLAIVHALALQKRLGTKLPIYSDSRNAMNWVRGGRCKTRLPMSQKSATVHDLIARAERWLAANPIDVPILKWQTDEWGEVPADFGRK